jgi:hypothetical protein
MNDSKTRHAAALLLPNTPEERTISNLFHELTILADRYHDDSVMLPAVEHVGSAIITLLNGAVHRIDQGSMDKQVRDTVQRAGGDGNGI